MLSKYLWITGSAIFLILGLLHLLYTFFTNKFLSRNENVVAEMKKSFPIISRQTTMWKAWVGFNASHSIGAIFFGAVNIILSMNYYQVLSDSLILQSLVLIVALSYLLLAVKYWFSIPLAGILISNCCFLTALITTGY